MCRTGRKTFETLADGDINPHISFDAWPIPRLAIATSAASREYDARWAALTTNL